ncbi:uncharacterized protein [Dermacentor albipictus]|uniref:uncharacterized protein n=1 Tax=Dermacentor albipictus TaxID=60249 RepID=UPI0031FBB467
MPSWSQREDEVAGKNIRALGTTDVKSSCTGHYRKKSRALSIADVEDGVRQIAMAGLGGFQRRDVFSAPTGRDPNDVPDDFINENAAQINSSKNKGGEKRENDSTLTKEGFETRSFSTLCLKPAFWAVVLGGALIDYTDCAFMATIVDSALDRGATRFQSDMSIACSAPSQLLGRTALPLIADLGLADRTTLACSCYFLFAASAAILAATRTFALYATTSAVACIFMGCMTTMKHVVVAEFFGVEVVPTAWAANGALVLPLLLGNPSILGLFRDRQGSYDQFYYSLSGLHVVVGVVYLFLLFSSKRSMKSWTPTKRRK